VDNYKIRKEGAFRKPTFIMYVTGTGNLEIFRKYKYVVVQW